MSRAEEAGEGGAVPCPAAVLVGRGTSEALAFPDEVVKSVDRFGQEAAQAAEESPGEPSSSWLPLLPVAFHFVHSQILIYFS